MRVNPYLLWAEFLLGVLPITLYAASITVALPLALFGLAMDDSGLIVIMLVAYGFGVPGVLSLWKIFIALRKGAAPDPTLTNGLVSGVISALILLGLVIYTAIFIKLPSSTTAWPKIIQLIFVIGVAVHWYRVVDRQSAAAAQIGTPADVADTEK